MPKSTFFNLSKEKQERILRAAINEFSENTYEIASINKVVQNSEISKGSFYQYFDNKKDLFKYLIQICQEEKTKYIEETISETRNYLDEFTKIREIYKSDLKFSSQKPKLSSIMDKLFKITDLELKKEILENLCIEEQYTFKNIISDGVDSGNIFYNTDIEFTSHLLENIQLAIKEYTKDKELKEGYVNYDSIIDSSIDLIENGIKLKKRKSKGIEGIF